MSDDSFDSSIVAGALSESSTDVSDSSSEDELTESSEEPDDSSDSDYRPPTKRAARSRQAAGTADDSTGPSCSTSVTVADVPQARMVQKKVVGNETKKQRTQKKVVGNETKKQRTQKKVVDSEKKKQQTQKKLVTKLSRPFRIGVPNLPHNFGWTSTIPTLAPKHFEPDRPPQQHAFLDSDESGYIFMSFYKPAFDVWLKGTNENGALLFGAKWNVIDEYEGHKFLSLLIASNVYRVSAWRAYWETDSLVDFKYFTDQMTRTRFLQVLRATRLFVASEAAASGASVKTSPNYDEKHKIRQMLNELLKEFRKKRAPGQYLSLDEQMVKCEAKCRFKTKMPNKPISEGLKFFALCEADNGYLHYADLASTSAKYDDEPFGRIFALSIDILRGGDLNDGISMLDKGHTIVTDNYYTRVELAHVLLARKTYLTGAVKLNIRFAPTDLFKNKSNNPIPLKPLKRGGCRFRFSKDGKMAYVMWRDNRVVLALSTEPDIGVSMGFVRRKGKKIMKKGKSMMVPIPTYIGKYIKFMRGVDVADQKIANQMQHHGSLRWYVQCFYQSIDWTILNTGVILRERPRGKALWTARRTKISVSRFLAVVGRNSIPQSVVITLPRSRDPFSLIHTRLNPMLRHLPQKMQKVVNGVVKTDKHFCVAHRQGVRTMYRCSCCRVPLHIAPYPCWENFHYKRVYLFDDVNSNALIRNTIYRY